MTFKELSVGDEFIINHLPAKKMTEKARVDVYNELKIVNAQVIDTDFHRSGTPMKYYIYVSPNRKVKLKEEKDES